MTNCPNCGAPIVSSTCEYCGTKFRNEFENNIFIDTENLVQAVRDGLMTPNQARRRLGLEEV